MDAQPLPVSKGGKGGGGHRPIDICNEGKAKENEGDVHDHYDDDEQYRSHSRNNNSSKEARSSTQLPAGAQATGDTTNADDEQEQEQEQEDDYTPMSSRGEPKGPPQACLFVASLSPDTPEDSLHEFFACYGDVLKIKLMKDHSSRPYAFVQYSSMEEADTALLQANNAVLDGRRLRVEKAKVNRTLFIAKMNRSLTNQKLRETVECYGPVESVTIIKNHQTQKSKGCGFAKFVFREDAMDAYLGLKNQFRKWVVEWATSSNDPDALGVDKFNVFVGGLNPQLVTKAALEERFSSHGHLENVTLINRGDPSQDPTMPPRSAFAFIRYSDAAASVSAIEQENGAEWLERRLRVQYCESLEMKSKRRTQKYFNALPNPYLPNNAGHYYPHPSPYPYPASMMMMGGVPMYAGAAIGGGGAGPGQKFGTYGMGRRYYAPLGPDGVQPPQHNFYGGDSFPSYPTYAPAAMGLGVIPSTYSPSWMYSSQSQQMMFDGQGYDIEEVDQFQQDDSALLQDQGGAVEDNLVSSFGGMGMHDAQHPPTQQPNEGAQ